MVSQLRMSAVAFAVIITASTAASADPAGTQYGIVVISGDGDGTIEVYGSEGATFDGQRDPLTDGRSIEEHYEDGHVGFWGYGPQPGTTLPGGIDVGYGPVFNNLGGAEFVVFQIVGLYWGDSETPVVPENLQFGLGFDDGEFQPVSEAFATLIDHGDVTPIMALDKEIAGDGTQASPLNIGLRFAAQDWVGATSFHFDFDVTHRPEIPTPAAAAAGLPMLLGIVARRRRRNR